MRARQAVITECGGPEVIGWHTVDVPPPGPGEVTLKQGAIGQTYPMEQAEQAHRDLEARATTGSTVLLP